MGSLGTPSLNNVERPATPHRTSRVSRYVTPVSHLHIIPITLLSHVIVNHFCPRCHSSKCMINEISGFVEVCGMYDFVISSSFLPLIYLSLRVLFEENVSFFLLICILF